MKLNLNLLLTKNYINWYKIYKAKNLAVWLYLISYTEINYCFNFSI